MSNPTPTPPQNPVPVEPGWYWATYGRYSKRIIVLLLQDEDCLLAYAHGDNFEINGLELSSFSDFSPRITEAQPPAAPVAKDGDALAVVERSFPSLRAELLQLRGIMDAHANLELGDDFAIGSGWFAATGTNRYFLLHRGKVLADPNIHFPSARMLLAWLRHPQGKAAVAAAKGDK